MFYPAVLSLLVPVRIKDRFRRNKLANKKIQKNYPFSTLLNFQFKLLQTT